MILKKYDIILFMVSEYVPNKSLGPFTSMDSLKS